MMNIKDALRKIENGPLFKGVYSAEVEDFLGLAEITHLEEGSYLLREGEKVSHLYIFLKGQGISFKEVRGQEIFLENLEEGSICGEMVFLESVNSALNVLITEESLVLAIRYDDMAVFFNNQPEIFGILLNNILNIVLKKLYLSNEIIFRIYEEGKTSISFPLYGRDIRKKT